MISIIEEDKPDKDWNKRLLKSGLGTIYQTAERAVYVKKVGVPVKFLKFIDNSGEIIGQLLIIFQPRFNSVGIRSKILKNTPFSKKTSCNWSYGPIIFNPDTQNNVYLTLVDYLKSHNYVVSGWTHPLSQHNLKGIDDNYRLQKWGTYLIDLKQDINSLYKNIDKHSGQKNIERSIKRGVTIEQLSENTLTDYVELINKSRRKDQQPADLDFFKFRWNIFHPLGYSGFLTRKDGIPIGGLLFSNFNGHIIEIGVARSQQDTKEKLYSQDLIKWNIIEWGTKNKMRYYDLTGFNPNPISQKEKGIEKYKRKWGGKTYYYYRILEKPGLLTKK